MGPSRREIIEGGLAGALAASAGSATARPSPRAPGPGRQDLLWYLRPADAWVEALPVGNGRLGAMVFGGVAHEHLQLNEDTLWTGGPYSNSNPAAREGLPRVRALVFDGKWAEAEALANEQVMSVPRREMAYQSLGDLYLDLPGKSSDGVRDYRRELDIDAAVARTRFTLDGVSYVREVIASSVDNVIAIRVTASGGALDLDISLATEQKAGVVAEGGDGLLMTGVNSADRGIAGKLRFASKVKVTADGGTVVAGERTVQVRAARSALILIAAATSYRRYDDVSGDPVALVRSQIGRAAAKPFPQLLADHVAEHRRLFRRVAIDLGRGVGAELPTDERVRAFPTTHDPALAALYFQYGRYLLISSSRPGTQPANLQGLWNDQNFPPWGSKYTININTEMNYWPAEPTSLAECAEPLIRLIGDLAETGAKTAREVYGARGWVAHHNTDLWRAAGPVDSAHTGLWPTGGAWLCTHLWNHYDYGRDPAFLATAYPLMRGAALFFLDTLVADPRSSFLVTCPSLSPENEHVKGATLCAGPTMDMQILRDLFGQTIQAAEILNVDPELRAQIAAARARLAPNKVGAAGQLQEWQQDWDMSAPDLHHRHVSHLYGLFPSQQINTDDTPELAAAARRSLEIRGDEATGWGLGWRLNLWAHLRDGEHAHKILTMLLGPDRTYPNLFDAHPPFQIDGNFGGVSGVTEMLVQSRGDLIDLLPALPRAWPTGRIAGVRTRGGASIDLAWRDGQVSEVAIATAHAGVRRLRAGGKTVEITLAAGGSRRLTAQEFS